MHLPSAIGCSYFCIYIAYVFSRLAESFNIYQESKSSVTTYDRKVCPSVILHFMSVIFTIMLHRTSKYYSDVKRRADIKVCDCFPIKVDQVINVLSR